MAKRRSTSALRIPARAARSLLLASRPERYLVLDWCRTGIVAENFGDKLNPFLAARLSGRKVVHVEDVLPSRERPVHFVIGSALEYAQAAAGVVWGMGFAAKDQGLRARPRAVHAVRGRHSLERLRSLGIECPEVLGDPALLLPWMYTPRPTGTRHKLGVIPHCRERDLPAVQPQALPEGTLRIDITGDLFTVVDQICSCDFIASSSLHGLICAEAYGIPARWIKLSNRPFGDGFKFHDYYSSVGKSVDGPLPVSEARQFARVREGFRASKPVIDLDRLLGSCPFLSEARFPLQDGAPGRRRAPRVSGSPLGAA